IPLLLIGCGGVGRQLLRQIVLCRRLHSDQGVTLRVIGICDSKIMVAVPDVSTSGFDDEFLSRFCELKSCGFALRERYQNSGECLTFSGREVAEKIIGFASALGKSTGLVLVDCSASSETVTLLTEALDSGCCAVLANKKPLTSSL
ncbi:homoserine dehydrogenase, partial [Genlisea aurea]